MTADCLWTFLEKFDPSWYLIVVGDAAMNPAELLAPGGAIDYFHQNESRVFFGLRKLLDIFHRSIWLNPEPKTYWQIPSTQIVRKIFRTCFRLVLKESRRLWIF